MLPAECSPRSNVVQVEKPNGKLEFIVINEEYTESALKPVRESEE